MRKKIIYYGALCLSLQSCGDANTDDTLGLILFVCLILIGMLILGVRAAIKEQIKEAERDARIAKQKALWQEKERARKKALLEERAAMIAQYGEITKEIPLYKYSDALEDMFIVFESSSTLFIHKRAYKFSNILGYSVTDNKQTIIEGGHSTSVTSTSTGSLVGRAVVGGVLLGGVGALAGASTAKKSTETISDKQIVNETHNFTIHINVNDLSAPIISLNTKGAVEKTQEIIGLLNIIINKNNIDNE